MHCQIYLMMVEFIIANCRKKKDILSYLLSIHVLKYLLTLIK